MKYSTGSGICVGVVSGCLVLGLSGAAGAQMLSPDEMLEYGVASIRSSMKEAAAKNQQLSYHNAALRQDIQGLKHELGKKEQQLLSLQRQNASLKSQAATDDQMVQTRDERMASLRKRKQQLDQELNTLRHMIELRSRESRQAQEAAQAMDPAVAELQRRSDQARGDLGSADDAGQKAQLQDTIQKTRDRLNRLSAQMDRLTRQIDKRMKEQRAALARRDDLEKDIAQWQDRLHEEAAREVVLRRSAEKIQQAALNSPARDAMPADERRIYRDALAESLQDLQASLQKIRSQGSQDETQMRQTLSLLKEQNKGLHEYQKVLGAGMILSGQDQDGGDDHAMILEERRQEMRLDQDRLADDLGLLRKQIQEQQQINRSFKTEEDGLNHEIKQLEKHVDKAQRSVAAIRKKTFGRAYYQVEETLEQQRQRVDDLNRQLSEVRQRWSGEQSARQDLGMQEEQVRAEIERLKELMSKARTKNQELVKAHQQLAEARANATDMIQAKIRQAEMRKDALAASVDAVRQKFDAGQDERLRFSSEQKELARYLDVLKQENQALQKKMQDL